MPLRRPHAALRAALLAALILAACAAAAPAARAAASKTAGVLLLCASVSGAPAVRFFSADDAKFSLRAKGDCQVRDVAADGFANHAARWAAVLSDNAILGAASAVEVYEKQIACPTGFPIVKVKNSDGTSETLLKM